jgi:cyclophilin family peptidyl-prolyl cis-trans isomerase
MVAAAGCLSGDDESKTYAVIETTEGTIKVELFADKVPTTVDNFVNLAQDGFFNGLVFHRIIDNFMIQTGAFYPNATYKQSPYGNIPLEIDEDLTHVNGAVAMARQGQNPADPDYFDTASSQFYICDGPQHSLDGYYAVFGKVVEGFEVVEAISAADTDTRDTPYGPMANWPKQEITINSVTIVEE